MDQRGPMVTALARSDLSHETELLQDVLVAVREKMPASQVTVFGGVPVDGATDYVHHPSYGRLVRLLYSSAVHLVTASERGSAVTGSLALAAGSALAIAPR
jgi:hypothetical protein